MSASRRRIVLTGGATREPIDAVRFVSNIATGALPAALAEAWLARGAEVHLIHGPGPRLPDGATVAAHLHLWPIATAVEAAARLEERCRSLQPDLVVCAMAVADYAPVVTAGKIASEQEELVIRMRPTPKAIDRVKVAAPHCRLVAFKLLAGADEEALIAAARRLAERCGADLVFGNDMADHQAGRRRGIVIRADGTVLARLDGGSGDGALRRLAEGLVDTTGFASETI